MPRAGCLDRLLTTLEELRATGVRVGAVIPVQRHPGEPGHDATEPWWVPNLTFNGALVPLEVIDEVGMLREDFFVGHEDKELSLRMRRAGYAIAKDPRASIDHANRRRPRVPSVPRAYYSRRNEAYLAVHVRHDAWGRTRVVGRTLASIGRTLVRDADRWQRARARARATYHARSAATSAPSATGTSARPHDDGPRHSLAALAPFLGTGRCSLRSR